MKKNLKSTFTRFVACVVAGCLVAQPASAALITISGTPLATAGNGSSVLPNLLFTLDSSGSMAWDYLPDYFDNYNNGNGMCMTRSGNGTDCRVGDPAWTVGGTNGANGVGYDRNVFYKPALKADGTTRIADPITVTSTPVDAFGAQSSSTIDVTTAITDNVFCNTASTAACKRNGTTGNNTTLASGTDGQGNTQLAGQFPYRTNLSSASTAVFGLPEMMSIGTFSRSGTTVTVTVLGQHGLVTGNFVYTSTGTAMDVLGKAVTVTNATTFTYTTGTSGTVASTSGVFRKAVSASFARSSSTVTVTSTNHGLVNNDIINVSTGTSGLDVTNVVVTVSNANTFTYASGTSGTIAATAGFWVRTGLYNVRSSTTGPAIAYSITPVEYCSDVNLTSCAFVLPGNTPPTGFTFPAYVRFCQTQEQAVAPGLISDASGTPQCRSKFVGYGANPGWIWARYGWFTRENIVSAGAPFTNRPLRGDCTTTAGSCTYTEEIQNYARWYAYYHTRMQMMKTVAGRAFQPFISTGSTNDKLRVGFITINPNYNNSSSSSNQGSVQSSKYLKIDTFRSGSGNQADNWYTKFYSQIPDQSTPLREALSRAGWIFAGKVNGANGTLTEGIPAADDPVIASCQRHFTLLTTDGYWNGNAGQDLNGNAIGNMDNVDPTVDTPYTTAAVSRPSGTFDGASGQKVQTVTTATIDAEAACVGNQQTNFAGLAGAGAGGETACSCSATQHRVVHRTSATTTTIATTDGVQDPTSPSQTTSATFPAAAAPNGTCAQGNYTQTVQPKKSTEILVCDQRSSSSQVTFTSGTKKSCSSCSNNKTGARYVLIREQTTFDVRNTTTDGTATETNATVNQVGPSYAYSNDGGATWVSTAPTGTGNCTTSNSGASALATVNNGALVPTSGAGTTLTLISPNPTAPVNGTPTTTITAQGGYSDTLADVAMYYYRSDLRGGKDPKGNNTGPALNASGTDVSPNNVTTKPNSKNYAKHQSMVTFTVGLADGLMRYQPDYDTAKNGDFFSITQGSSGACFWVNGTCNWPQPIGDNPSALDDLWHAAVNGRGQYYLGTNVDALSAGIQNTLTSLGAQDASAAASAISSPNVTPTDNLIFSTTYETNTWAGKVFAQTINTQDGSVNATHIWDADTLVLGRVTANSDTRNLYTFSASGSNNLKSFTFSALDPTTEQPFFMNKCSTNIPLLSQCTLLSAAQQATINAGSTLVDFLRGQTGNEASLGSTSPLYRDRTYLDVNNNVINTIMGDTVTAKPNFVRAPIFDYGGTYDAFLLAQANRASRVYVGANDGYLHAFDGDAGTESWGYTPHFIMKDLYALADKNYASVHRYFVDGSPEVNDVLDPNPAPNGTWRTILVGGTGGGGRGYYALDVTDPANPKALWEWCSDSAMRDPTHSDTDLGLTYGNPIFGKRSVDGRWVVIFSSGLNNVSPGTTGGGYFFIVDAITGNLLNKMPTLAGSPLANVGTTTTPSGLMKIAPFYTNGGRVDATFQYVYGGDQLGNVWRLDVGAATPVVTKLTTLKDGAGRTQPVTTHVIPTVVGTDRVLIFGTGRYLGTPDLSDQGAGNSAWQQSLYVFKDKVYSAAIQANLRTDSLLVQRQLTQLNATTGDRGISTTPLVNVDWTTNDGWFLDFNPVFGGVQDSPGEGVNLVDPNLIVGNLFVTTTVPATAAGGAQCAAGGISFNYQFDFKQGFPVISGTPVATRTSVLTVGVAVIQLPSGAIKAIETGSDTSKTPITVNTPASASIVKRFSYRAR